MNKRPTHKTYRLLYLMVIVTVICICIALASCAFVSTSSDPMLHGVTCALQCLIPVLCIALAGIIISLPGKIVRSKGVLFSMFVVLVIYGIVVNHYFLGNDSHTMFERIFLPFNTTLASFFPSRGTYSYFISVYNRDWLIPYLIFHALTYFYFAWLGFSLFGRQLLNRAAIFFIPRNMRNFIWGYSEGALELAMDMLRSTERDEPIIVLDDDIEFDQETERRIFDKLSNESIMAVDKHYGSLSDSPEDFQSRWSIIRYLKYKTCSGAFFHGKRHYFITEDQDFNVKYALMLMNQLAYQKESLSGITHIYVRTELEGVGAFFQEKRKNGLESLVEVHIFNQSDITARQFVDKYPVLDLANRTNPLTGKKWLTIHHDNLQVEGEVNILLLGLGWTGWEMLKKQVCNAQFIGDNKVNIVVVDNDYKQFHGRYQPIIEEAARFGVNICINPMVWIDENHKLCQQSLRAEQCAKVHHLEERNVHQANSQLFYEWLAYTDEALQMPNILYFNRIIVALGSDELNVNTALQLTNFRNHYLSAKEANDPSLMPEPIFAHVRDRERYAFYEKHAEAPIITFGGLKHIYSVSNLVNEKMDIVAKMVNYVYSQYLKEQLSREELMEAIKGNAAETAWAKCSIFDQDSSRAVALNLQNIITLTGGLNCLQEMLCTSTNIDILGELEHMRWNAFHYMRGIAPWPIEQVQIAKDDKGKVKPKGKLFFNGTLVRHICLVGYDQLDEATCRVQSLGNTSENFKASDLRIIRHFPTFYEIKTAKK